MTSLLTNIASLSGLQALKQTQSDLAKVQSQISTGQRVQSAADNAAYWSISTTMKSDTGALSSVMDALSLGSSTVSVATSALTSAISVMNTIKQDLVTAQEPGVDLKKVQSDIAAQQSQLRSIANSASFNGQNLLSVNSDTTVDPTYLATKNIVASFQRDSTGNVTIGTISLDTTQTVLFDPHGTATPGQLNTTAKGFLDTVDTTSSYLTTSGGSTTSTGVSIDAIDVTQLSSLGNLGQASVQDALVALTKQVDNAIGQMTAAATSLGATTTRINIQSNFVSSLSTSITEGVGSLVDADMNQASTRLSALQTQQQLGIQALGIANQNAALILKLFGG